MDLDVLSDTLFDGESILREPATVRIRDRKIDRIEPGHAPAESGVRRFDARGRLVAPGLVNAHVHIARGGMFEPNEPIGVAQVVRNLRECLAAGVTTVGDMGCASGLIAALREHVARSASRGPAIVASGPVLTAPRGYPLDWMPPLLVRLGVALGCADAREAAEAVRSVASAGMDHVKIAIMHQSYGRQPLPAVTPVVGRAVVEEAHASGLRTLAHAHTVADYDVALQAGVDALMHSSFEPLDATMVARVRDAGIPVCPTLWVFESACLGAELRYDREPRFVDRVEPAIARSWTRFAEAYAASGDVVPPGIAGGASKSGAHESVRIAAANLALLRDAGVPIAFGNDANYGFSLVARPFDELVAMQRAGMSALECLSAATAVSARLLGLRDRGSLAPGKRADLVVLPLEAERDVTFVEQVHAVIAHGEIVDPLADAPLEKAATVLAWAGGLARTVAAGAVHAARRRS